MGLALVGRAKGYPVELRDAGERLGGSDAPLPRLRRHDHDDRCVLGLRRRAPGSPRARRGRARALLLRRSVPEPRQSPGPLPDHGAGDLGADGRPDHPFRRGARHLGNGHGNRAVPSRAQPPRPGRGGGARRAAPRPRGNEAHGLGDRAGDLRSPGPRRQAVGLDGEAPTRSGARPSGRPACSSATRRRRPSGRAARWRAPSPRASSSCCCPTGASATWRPEGARRGEDLPGRGRRHGGPRAGGISLRGVRRPPGREGRPSSSGAGGPRPEPRDRAAARALPDRSRGADRNPARGPERMVSRSSGTITATPTIRRGRRKPIGASPPRGSPTASSTWSSAWRRGNGEHRPHGCSGTRPRPSKRSRSISSDFRGRQSCPFACRFRRRFGP